MNRHEHTMTGIVLSRYLNVRDNVDHWRCARSAATASMNILSPTAGDVVTASIGPPSSRCPPPRLGLVRFNAHSRPSRPPQTPAASSKRLYRK